MAEQITLSLDTMTGHLVEPPLVDMFHIEPADRAYAITFVPDDTMSHEQKETVAVPMESVEGRQITELCAELFTLLGREDLELFVHSGGGHFAFRFGDDSGLDLTDLRFDAHQTLRILDLLKRIAIQAAIAFRLAQAAAA